MSREVRGLQSTPKCWLPHVRPVALTARSVPASSVAFLAVALRAVACFAPTSTDIEAIARTAVAFYGLEPETYQQAITGPDASRWKDAMQAEIDAMQRLKAFEVVPTSVVTEGVKVLPAGCSRSNRTSSKLAFVCEVICSHCRKQGIRSLQRSNSS